MAKVSDPSSAARHPRSQFYLSNLNLKRFFDFFCVTGLLVTELGVDAPFSFWMLNTFDCFSGVVVGVVGVDCVIAFAGLIGSISGSTGSQQSVIKILGTVMSSGLRHGFRKCDWLCFHPTYPSAAFLKSFTIRGPRV